MCKVCGRNQDTRLDVCFDCAGFESLIYEKKDMYEKPIVKTITGSESLNILKAIIDFYSVKTKEEK